jgi:hypothetical protein
MRESREDSYQAGSTPERMQYHKIFETEFVAKILLAWTDLPTKNTDLKRSDTKQ